ncbi:hypothetical protein Taro_044485 [Colocasia esculenta]|uniref:Aminotransferase-like plant mobile domain-containing protein n=1 Tax=Colocasia esculenta TaxID=4460 RepID=A0A843WU64_COLES|nr:hypothetical protein [Colocasia esculenta]
MLVSEPGIAINGPELRQGRGAQFGVTVRNLWLLVWTRIYETPPMVTNPPGAIFPALLLPFLFSLSLSHLSQHSLSAPHLSLTMVGGGKWKAKWPRAKERMAAASPADSAEGSGQGSTSVAGNELALVLATTATGRGGGAAAMEDGGAAAREEEAPVREAEAPAREEEAPAAAWAARRQGRDLPALMETGVMRPCTMWPLVVAAYRGLPAFQRERVREMGFGSILEIELFFVDPPLIQVIRDRWDRVSRTFLFPWGRMVPSLEDVARITGLWVDGEAVTGVTYADYTDLTQQLLGLEPFGQDDHERRMVGRVALLQSLGLAGVRQMSFFLPLWSGPRETYGPDAEDTVRADRDLRRFLVFFFGKMLFTTKGDDIHCRFLELLDDLTRVGRYAWGDALLAHTFADLSTGMGRETTVGGFVPFLQVWSHYYLPLGRATEVDPTAVPLARRWLPLVSTATYAFQLDVLRWHVRDFPALLVVWEPYVDYGDADQPWVVSGRGLFRRDIWVHCLNEIEPLRLRLAARTLGLHQRWIGEEEPRGIGRKTRGKAKTVDWRTRFPEQFSDWHRGGQVVTSYATDSTAYLQRYQEEYGPRNFMRPERDGHDTLIGQLEGQLAATTAQLGEARAALEILRTAQGAAVQAKAGGASSSRGSTVVVEVSSLQEQLAAAVARVERAERDLAIRSEELESALARETLAVAEQSFPVTWPSYGHYWRWSSVTSSVSRASGSVSRSGLLSRPWRRGLGSWQRNAC